MSLGQTLRTAREAKGITASELAARTHLLVQIVEGLEKEDFRRIPAPIYGRGFIKLYCAEVGLDPKPLQDEFTALYALGKDAPDRVVQPTAAPPKPEKKSVPKPQPPPPEPAPVPVVAEPEPTPKPVQIPAPTPEPTAPVAPPAPPPQPTPVPPVASAAPDTPAAPDTNTVISNEPPPRRSYGELFEQAYATAEPEKPSAAEKFRDTMSNVSHGVFANVKKLPPNTGRIVTVCIATLLLLALLGWGIAMLYKATTVPGGEPPSTDVQPAVKPAEKPTEPPAAKPAEKPIEKPAEKPAAKPAEKPVEKPAAKTPGPAPMKQPTAKPTAKPAAKPVSKPTGKAAPAKGKVAVKPKDLKATGQKVPPLYID